MGHEIDDCFAHKRLDAMERWGAQHSIRNAEHDAAREARWVAKKLKKEVMRLEWAVTRITSRVCFKCGEAGHLRATCPMKTWATKDWDVRSVSTAATVSDLTARSEWLERKGWRFDKAVAKAVATPPTASIAAAPCQTLRFGPSAFLPLRTRSPPDACVVKGGLEAQVETMVRASVPNAAQMRGQRGELCVTEMLSRCYANGLWMHGPPTSPLNILILPAIRHIFAEMAKLPPTHTKRVECLSTLTLACQDCQQVQAREILRIFSDLTAQTETLDEQLKYSLVHFKEEALNCYITRRHPKCDLDYTQVQPEQQRPHLWSAYITLIGDSLGLDGTTAAKSDRFLAEALQEIGQVNAEALAKDLQRAISVEEWLRTLLADINNQTPAAERLIDRDCVFKWAQANMSTEAAHLVFYDAERSTDFADQEPKEPTRENAFQPFLSRKVLIDILVTAGMLCSSGGKPSVDHHDT